MRNLILVTCDHNYSEVLSASIPSIQRYATKVKADLQISYGGFPYIDRYIKLLEVSNIYENISHFDSDNFVSRDAPNIFELDVKTVGFKIVEKTNQYRNTICKFGEEFFGKVFDSDYYSFCGLFVGTRRHIQKLAKETISLWEKNINSKESPFLYNDEIYVAQVLKQYYPDFTKLDSKWIINSDLALNGHPYYIAHPFKPKDEKIQDIIKLSLQENNMKYNENDSVLGR